jgi:hypothetical protein
MFGILISIILSVQLKTRDYSQKKSFNQKTISNGKNSKSDRRFLADNLFGCYLAYNDVITSYANPENAAKKFIEICKGSYDGDCKDVVDDLTGSSPSKPQDEFQDKCAVDPPAQNKAGCYSAYGALIQALEGLTYKKSAKNILKAAPEEQYDDFLDKCPETANNPTCSVVLNGLTSKYPTKDDLTFIKGGCVVADPDTDLNPNSDPNENSNPADENPADPKGDAGIASLNLSSKLILFISVITHLYFLI